MVSSSLMHIDWLTSMGWS